MSEEIDVAVQDVLIPTPDGTCNAAFMHPVEGTYPGVLFWADAFGLRPTTRDLAIQLAAEGYAVLVPNPFYRVDPQPFTTASNFSFGNPDDMAKLWKLIGSLKAPGVAEIDAAAYISFLDSRPEVDKSHKIGTQGYCMGGPLAIITAATVPDRVGAVASFHGGGLATDKPDSPHLLAPKVKATVYIAIAAHDDAKEPAAKDTLKEAFSVAHVPAEIEVYPGALHGWCMADMPAEQGKPIYNQPDAERAWAKLLALYRAAL
jgi:carboxymethylenebutenolidase